MSWGDFRDHRCFGRARTGLPAPDEPAHAGLWHSAHQRRADAAADRTATAPCRSEGTEYDADVPSPKNLAEIQPALSPGGHYLVKGGNAFDLKTGKGSCTDSGEGAKKITPEAVGDDATACGLAGEGTPRTPVSVSVATGTAEPLPEATSNPNAITKSAGVYVTHAGTDSMRLIVLDLKN